MEIFKFVRVWLALLVVVVVLGGGLGLAYHFGSQSKNVTSQQQQITALTNVERNQSALLGAVCTQGQNTWNTFQRVIAATANPPSQAGHQLTAAQLAALAKYREGLISSVGPEPKC